MQSDRPSRTVLSSSATSGREWILMEETTTATNVGADSQHIGLRIISLGHSHNTNWGHKMNKYCQHATCDACRARTLYIPHKLHWRLQVTLHDHLGTGATRQLTWREVRHAPTICQPTDTLNARYLVAFETKRQRTGDCKKATHTARTSSRSHTTKSGYTYHVHAIYARQS